MRSHLLNDTTAERYRRSVTEGVERVAAKLATTDRPFTGVTVDALAPVIDADRPRPAAGRHVRRPRRARGRLPPRRRLLPPPPLPRPPQLPGRHPRRPRRGRALRRQLLARHLGPDRRRHPHRAQADRLDRRAASASAPPPTASSPAAAPSPTSRRCCSPARRPSRRAAERLARRTAHLRLRVQPLQRQEVGETPRPRPGRRRLRPRRPRQAHADRRPRPRAGALPRARASSPWRSSPPPAPPTSAPSTRCPRSPSSASSTAPGCTSTPRTAADCCLPQAPPPPRRHRARRLGHRGLPQVLLPAGEFVAPCWSATRPRCATPRTTRSTSTRAAWSQERIPNQVDKSLQTTRRFDALKLWMTLRVMGADGIGELFDEVCDLAERGLAAARRRPALRRRRRAPAVHPRLPLHPGRRHRPRRDRPRQPLRPQGPVRLRRGRRRGTKVGGRQYLKFTLLNPETTRTTSPRYST